MLSNVFTAASFLGRDLYIHVDFPGRVANATRSLNVSLKQLNATFH